MNLAAWLPALFVLGATGAAGVVLTNRHLRRFPWAQRTGNSIATSAHVYTVPDRRLLAPGPVVRGLENARETRRRRS